MRSERLAHDVESARGSNVAEGSGPDHENWWREWLRSAPFPRWSVPPAPWHGSEAPMVSLDHCMALLLGEKIEADCSGLRALGPDPVAHGFFRDLWHEGFQFRLRSLVLEKGGSCGAKDPGELARCWSRSYRRSSPLRSPGAHKISAGGLPLGFPFVQGSALLMFSSGNSFVRDSYAK